MSKPRIVTTQPVVIELEAGDYYWCSCGESSVQPFCDGSHQGTDFTPVKLSLDKKQGVGWCLCKHTNNPPLCDGTHSQL